MNTPDKIRILIVDDHAVVGYGLSALLNAESDMTVVASGKTGEEAVEQFRCHRPDLVLMDLRMPGMSGLEAIREILLIEPKARIIVLTTYGGDEDIRQALDAGAQGYVLKGAPEAQLFDAMRRVHAGMRFIPKEVARLLASRPPNSKLTPREYEVLKLIVKGLSNKAIGEKLGICEGTVKCHVNTILARLGVEDRTQAAVTALQRGLVHM